MPDSTTRSPRSGCQRGCVPGLRRLHRCLYVRRYGSEGLHEQTDYCGGRCDMQVNEYKPLIVAFCCNWCSYAGADLAGNNRLITLPTLRSSACPAPAGEPHVYFTRVSARGRRRDPLRLPSRRLPLHPGNYYTRRRMTLLFSMLDFLGIEKVSAPALSGYLRQRARSLPPQ